MTELILRPFKKKKKDTAAEDSANRYMQENSAAGAARIRARGRGAIVQARAIFKKAGTKPPASLRLPTPKRKPK